ncbi:MAG: Zn-ribbon domain-containing OB-fold protein [Armatimonadota bacterium]
MPDPDTAPFWQGCREHELRAQRCGGCSSLRWPPRGLCPRCHSWAFDWVALGNTGTVASFVVVHRATSQAFATEVPYVIAQVTLDDTNGLVRLASNVVGYPWDQVRVGMAVRVEFEDVTPEVTLPKFRPIPAA